MPVKNEISSRDLRKWKILWIFITIIWIISVLVWKLFRIPPGYHSIFLAPPIEEIFKGFSVFLISLSIFNYSERKGLDYDHRIYVILSAFLFGSLFALLEDLLQFQKIIFSGIIFHFLWTSIVSLNFLDLQFSRKRTIPIILVVMTVLTHHMQNYHAYFSSQIINLISISLTVILFLSSLILAKFPKNL